MKAHFWQILVCSLFLIQSCQKNKIVSWDDIKSSTQIDIHLTSEYENPHMLPISGEAWEDGVFITRDGLDMYCIYLPADLIAFASNGAKQKNSGKYLRGDVLEMDIVTNPDGRDNWIHGDIYHSTRASLTDEFINWEAVNIAIPVFNEGAPQGQINSGNSDFDLFVYMKQNESDPYDNNIHLQMNVSRSLESSGTLLSSNINSEYNEDNPHIERLSPDSLILFFERENHPDNISDFDIWYSISSDNGLTWTNPINLNSINNYGSTNYEHIQPHLYFDISINNWYLYFTTTYTNNNLAIFRAEKGNSWSDWNTPEVVISSGNAIGIGEPTLTEGGDLYFVVVYEHPDGTKYNKFDCDPWMIKKK